MGRAEVIQICVVILSIVAISISIAALVTVNKTEVSTAEKFDLYDFNTFDTNVEYMRSISDSQSSEEAGNRKLLDMGQEIGSKSGILYGLEIVNNYVIGGDNSFIIIICGTLANSFSAVQTCMNLLDEEQLDTDVNYIIGF